MKLLLLSAILVVGFYYACANDGSLDSSSEEGIEACNCGKKANDNPCRKNNGITNLGCSGTNRYVTCTNTTCANLTCPTGQVWNSTVGSCVPCPTGFQISADGRICVCNTGTTPSGRKTCGPCPTNSVITQYWCKCNNVTALNYQTNACQDCPPYSTLKQGNCVCDATYLWNVQQWACVQCPASSTSVTKSGRLVSCLCPAGQIFNRQTVTCDTCPAGTQPDNDNDECECPISGQYYNPTSQACECPTGKVLNSAGTRCTYVSPSTAPQPV